MQGHAVPGYNLGWSAYSGDPQKGKTIVAYNSAQNTAAIFVQPDHAGASATIEGLRSLIHNADYDYALAFDGSDSAALNYHGTNYITPSLLKNVTIPVAIGFRHAH